MKKLILVIAAVISIYGCSSAPNIEGNWSVKVDFDQVEKTNTTALGFLAMADVSYTFESDGTGTYNVSMGAIKNTQEIDWLFEGNMLNVIGEKIKDQSWIYENDKFMQVTDSIGMKILLVKEQ